MWGVTAVAILAFTVSPGVARTPLAVQAEDGVTLHVVEYRADAKVHRRTLVLLGDGIEGSSSSETDGLAEALFLSGFDVITWDRRGTGHSEGVWDYGSSDEVDFLAVTSAISSRTFGHEVGLVGIGTGGVEALKVFNRTANAKALAIYGVGPNGVPDSTSGAWKQLNQPGSVTGRWLLRLRGVRMTSNAVPEGEPPANLTRLITKLGSRPLMIGAGGRDRRVPSQDTLALFRAAHPPKEWLFAPAADDSPPISELAPRFEDFFRRRLR